MTTNTPIHEAVREHYAERIKNNASCCGGDSCCSPESSLYPSELLATLPHGESTISYGCGDPITLAALQPGQTVLDLGSGAGLDCFFASFPPEFKTRNASVKTLDLSGERLITQFEMMTSTLLDSTGRSSRKP